MPRPKRYFPVSREVNDDAELWALTDEFGDRTFRLWMEILACLDKTENRWKLAGDWLAVVSRKVRQQPATVWRTLHWMMDKHWLTAKKAAADGSPVILSSPKYWKYHRFKERDGSVQDSDEEAGTAPLLPYPNLPYPNRTKKSRRGDGVKAVDSVDSGQGNRKGVPPFSPRTG